MRNHPSRPSRADRVVAEVEAAREEIVAFTADLIRIPTVNPPGDFYRDCAVLIGRQLAKTGLAVQYVQAEGRPEHTAAHPARERGGARGGGGGPPAPTPQRPFRCGAPWRRLVGRPV